MFYNKTKYDMNHMKPNNDETTLMKFGQDINFELGVYNVREAAEEET